MSIIETLLLKTFLHDINAQPNLFHRNFLKLLKNPPTDFSFDLYSYYIAKKNKYQIIKFPVLFTQRLHGQSHWNINFSEKWKFIKRTFDYSLKLKQRIQNEI